MERRSERAVRMAALGGVLGPVSFIGAWFAGAALTDMTYSSVDDAISRLAAVDADTRWLMTAGFVGFGIGLPLYAWALRAVVPGPAWIAAATTGLATLAVAATPLDHSAGIDRLHGLAAGLGYVTLVATPLLAAGPLRRLGHRTLAGAGVVAGVASAIALVATTTGLPRGLFQRTGLTVTDVWIIASALAIATGRVGRQGRAPSVGSPGATPSHGGRGSGRVGRPDRTAPLPPGQVGGA